jgi:hypothetical protein
MEPAARGITGTHEADFPFAQGVSNVVHVKEH